MKILFVIKDVGPIGAFLKVPRYLAKVKGNEDPFCN
jgi:hypothetical protein